MGGNSKTAMIATISPSHHHIEETLSTLRYAHQASHIVNTARVNEDQKTRIIKSKYRTQSALRYADQASHIVNTARVNEDQKTRIIKSKYRTQSEIRRPGQSHRQYGARQRRPENTHHQKYKSKYRTQGTLRYAHQASHIVNTARVNEDQKTRIIKSKWQILVKVCSYSIHLDMHTRPVTSLTRCASRKTRKHASSM